MKHSRWVERVGARKRWVGRVGARKRWVGRVGAGNRWGASAVVLAVVAFAAVSARAQDLELPSEGVHHRYESPEHFNIQLGLSPFLPNVDSDPALHGKTPFADAFGNGHTLMINAEIDWEALRIPHLGTLGPGLGIGYANFSGNAAVSNPTPGGPTTSSEQTSLEIYPFYAVAVLRADAFWHEYGVPFVPYAKIGVATSLWRASNTLGTSHYNGIAGEGYTLGTQMSLGVAFVLNIFDPYAAREFDESMGVNTTAVFVEWSDASRDGLLVQSDPLHVGGTYWTFGMAFTF